MIRLIGNTAILVTLSACAISVNAGPRPLPVAPASAAAVQTDSMTRYRDLAGETLAAFKSGDKSAAKTKARDLEKAWDGEQKALKSKSPAVWTSVDDAMDAFIKPLMKGGSPDAAAVQAAYDAFIAQLDAAAKG